MVSTSFSQGAGLIHSWEYIQGGIFATDEADSQDYTLEKHSAESDF